MPEPDPIKRLRELVAESSGSWEADVARSIAARNALPAFLECANDIEVALSRPPTEWASALAEIAVATRKLHTALRAVLEGMGGGE